MNVPLIEILGLIAGVLTTSSFIPQVFKIVKTKDVASISLIMYVAFTIGILLWCIYGYVNNQIALFITNAITLCLSSLILFMKIKYK